MPRADSGVDARLKVSTHAEQTSFFQLPADSSAFRQGVADGRWVQDLNPGGLLTLRMNYIPPPMGDKFNSVVNVLRLKLLRHSRRQICRSALGKRGFPMPIKASVLRSHCGSPHPLFLVRYIRRLSPLASPSDSSSNACFIITGDIIQSTTLSDLRLSSL